MITLHDKDSGVVIGTITETDLSLLVDSLEKESRTDTDYYIQAGTIDLLVADGASTELLTLLRNALGTKNGVEVAWTRT
jgi:processive 1,2-diacylglycerol beta-glucosyltransferase